MRLSVGVSVTDLVILCYCDSYRNATPPKRQPICEISGSHVRFMILSLLIVAVPVRL